MADDATIIKLREIFGAANIKERNFFDEKRRPTNWSMKANAPYYTEACALDLKSDIDVLIENAKNGIFDELIYHYTDYPKYSPNTLYLKVNQSKLYLLQHLDNEGIYKTFFEYVKITRDKGCGVRISFLEQDTARGGELKATPVIPKDEQHVFVEDQVDDFLKDAKPGDKFHLKNISLAPDAIDSLKVSLQELVDILYRVNSKEIFIVKLTEEQLSNLK